MSVYVSDNFVGFSIPIAFRMELSKCLIWLVIDWVDLGLQCRLRKTKSSDMFESEIVKYKTSD